MQFMFTSVDNSKITFETNVKDFSFNKVFIKVMLS